jgi:HAD superfamily hydrolase (TIGR01509 family)
VASLHGIGVRALPAEGTLCRDWSREPNLEGEIAMPRAVPRFLYFDVGNVLLKFERVRVARQMAAVAGISPQQAWEIVYESDLLVKHEQGGISSRQFYEEFCTASKTRPDFAKLCHAASDIFELNTPVIPIVAQLKAARHRLGILSNTNETHWDFIGNGRYRVIQSYFEQYVLSHEVKAIKPQARIFYRAAEVAGLAPDELFFVDDREENVVAARQVGIDAVQFTSAAQLAKDLRSRGVRFNY